MTNDGVLGGDPPHRDAKGLDAIGLTNTATGDCVIDGSMGHYIKISTVSTAP